MMGYSLMEFRGWGRKYVCIRFTLFTFRGGGSFRILSNLDFEFDFSILYLYFSDYSIMSSLQFGVLFKSVNSSGGVMSVS